MIKTIHIVILLASFGTAAFCTAAQTPYIDRLKKELANKKRSDAKTSSLVALCGQYYSLNTNTFCNYANQAHQLAMVSNNEIAENKSRYLVFRTLMVKGRLDTAISFVDASLSWFKNYQTNMPLQID